MSRTKAGPGGGQVGGRGRMRDKGDKGWSEDELDEAEAGFRVFGTLMYEEEGEAKETKAYKKAQAAAQAQNAKPPWEQVQIDICSFPAPKSARNPILEDAPSEFASDTLGLYVA